MDLPCRKMRKNHSRSIPKFSLFLDVETGKEKVETLEKHTMKMGWTAFLRQRTKGAKNSERWEFWEDAFEMCAYIEDLATVNSPLYLFGHNVFFDLQASDFFYYFTRWKWVLDFVYDKGQTYILVITKGKKTIKCISTTNYFTTSVEGLGEIVGKEKLGIDFEKSSPEELKVYCRRDTEIIKEAIEYYWGFIKEYDLGKFAMTRSSQAFTAYRHRFMKKDIYVHQVEKVVDLERQAYYGGRVEAFHFGECKDGPFITLDINSMYPHIMQSSRMPVKLVDYREDTDLTLLPDILKEHSVVARCRIKTELPLYAIRHNKKIVFPIGEYETFLCTEGVKRALKLGHLLSISEMSIYTNDFLFTAWVDFLYALRLQFKREKQAILEYMCKIMLNSLYGKFGQKFMETDETEEITGSGYWRCDNYDFETGERWIEFKLMNKRIVQKGEKNGKNAFVAIAAHICENGRLMLYDLMDTIGRDKVLYCDTDGVKIRKRDMETVNGLLHHDRLGAIKIEDETNKLIINGAKNYETDKGVKIKGIPKKAEKIGKDTYRYNQFLRQTSHLRLEVDRYFMVKEVVKHSPPKYDKGIVTPTGAVLPFVFQFPLPPS